MATTTTPTPEVKKTAPITLTATAVAKVREIMAQQNPVPAGGRDVGDVSERLHSRLRRDAGRSRFQVRKPEREEHLRLRFFVQRVTHSAAQAHEFRQRHHLRMMPFVFGGKLSAFSTQHSATRGSWQRREMARGQTYRWSRVQRPFGLLAES